MDPEEMTRPDGARAVAPVWAAAARRRRRVTAGNTCALFARLGVGRILAVSHSFHLPRIKMTCAHAGREVYTVPAKETYILTQMPYLMMREVAAFWVCYARSIAG